MIDRCIVYLPSKKLSLDFSFLLFIPPPNTHTPTRASYFSSNFKLKEIDFFVCLFGMSHTPIENKNKYQAS